MAAKTWEETWGPKPGTERLDPLLDRFQDLPGPAELLHHHLCHEGHLRMGRTTDGGNLLHRGEKITLLSGSDQAGEGWVELRAVLGHEAVADADPNSLLLPLQPFLQREQKPQIPNPLLRVFIEEAFALGDQIGHIGGILGIVFVPAAI